MSKSFITSTCHEDIITSGLTESAAKIASFRFYHIVKHFQTVILIMNISLEIILSSFSSFPDLFYVIEWSLSSPVFSWILPTNLAWNTQRGNYGGRDRSPNRRNNYRQRSRSRSPRRNRQGASSDRNERRPHKRLRENSPLPRGERWAFMKSSSSYSLLTSTLLQYTIIKTYASNRINHV